METPFEARPGPGSEPAAPDDPAARPLWPVWYGFVGFVVAFIGTTLAVGIGAAIAGIHPNDNTPAFVVLGTLLQGAVFVATAVGFAGMVKPPRLWHFGLRPSPFWRTLGWAAAGTVGFYIFSAVYVTLFHPHAEQTVTQDLGANQSTLGLVVAGFVVITVAPVVEEFFFRGFFYRSLRSGLSVLPAAAIVGVVFGLIHFTGKDSLASLPLLGVLGFTFCLVYEKTKTLLAPIGMHAVNNMIAYGYQAHNGWKVSVVVGPLMLVALVLVARRLPRPPLGEPTLGVGTVVGR